MRINGKQIATALSRCVRLRCPACGEESIVQRFMRIRHHCPFCETLFKREEGFFVGAILVNVVATETLIMVTYLLWLMLVPHRETLMLAVLFSEALIFPLFFYHYSWSLWLGLNHLVESLPKHSGKP
jgi:uncharacterized protein (DUF983 family)